MVLDNIAVRCVNQHQTNQNNPENSKVEYDERRVIYKTYYCEQQ